MTDLRTLARALGEAAQAIHEPEPQGELRATLEAIARAASTVVPGFDHVGVTVVQGDGSATTMASTGRFALEMDNLQYELDQGPCLSALRRESLVLVEDLEQQGHDWPLYVPPASRAGVRAQMALQLVDGGETLGGLNFYSTASQHINPEAPRRAELFAVHAALALGHARQVDATGAMPTGQLVGQAVGILMERFLITEDQAMHYLIRVATAAELGPRDVARAIVDQVNGRWD